MAPFRLGIVGFGRLAREYYCPALRGLAGVDQVLVADPLEASRDAARRALPGARVFTDPGDLLAQGPDGLIVATPPSTHLALWSAAMRAGVPVLMEKPFVLMGELAEATGTPREQSLLMIDFNRRFWPPYQRIAEMVRSGALGEIVSAELTLQVDVRPWCAVTAHRLDPVEGGALFVEGRRRPGDNVRIELIFPGGAVARCRVGYGESTWERLCIEGRSGRVRMANPNMCVHQERGRAASPWATVSDLATLGWRGLFRSRSMSRRSISLVIATFVDGVRRSVPFSPGFAEAARSSRLLEAAARAVELGTTVDLPLAQTRVAHG